MPYLVRPDGFILAETLPEAIALSDALTAHHEGRLSVASPAVATPTRSAPSPIDQPFGPSLWSEFLAHVDRGGQPTTRNLLATIQSLGDGRMAKADLDAALGLAPEKLSGLLSGIAKNAKKAGLATSDVYLSVHRGYGKNRTIHYRAGKMLLAAPPIAKGGAPV